MRACIYVCISLSLCIDIPYVCIALSLCLSVYRHTWSGEFTAVSSRQHTALAMSESVGWLLHASL